MVYGLFYMGESTSSVSSDYNHLQHPAIPFGSGLGFVLGGAPSEWRWCGDTLFFKLYLQTKQMGSSNHSWPDSPVRPSCPLLHVRPSQVPPLLISSAFFVFALTDLLEF